MYRYLYVILLNLFTFTALAKLSCYHSSYLTLLSEVEQDKELAYLLYAASEEIFLKSVPKFLVLVNIFVGKIYDFVSYFETCSFFI